MDWFYFEANQQRGPFSDEQLRNQVRVGKVLPTTLVWREGMANWQPYSSIQPTLELISPVSVPRVIGDATVNCVECGRAFGSADVVRIQNFWVCATCKPVLLQRMMEGAPLPATAGIWRSGKEVVAPKGATFPDRCVKCNAPVQGRRLKRNLYWYPPYVLLLLVLSLLIGLIVAHDCAQKRES